MEFKNKLAPQRMKAVFKMQNLPYNLRFESFFFQVEKRKDSSLWYSATKVFLPKIWNMVPRKLKKVFR